MNGSHLIPPRPPRPTAPATPARVERHCRPMNLHDTIDHLTTALADTDNHHRTAGQCRAPDRGCAKPVTGLGDLLTRRATWHAIGWRLAHDLANRAAQLLGPVDRRADWCPWCDDNAATLADALAQHSFLTDAQRKHPEP